jgi:hypothetical protein
VGTALVGLALAMPVVEQLRPSFNSSLIGIVSIFVCLFVVIPACLIFDRHFLFGSWLDVQLGLFAVAELFIVVPLFRASTGAWVNYAIQGTIFAAILTARAMSRAFDDVRLVKALIPLSVVPVVLLAIEIKDDYRTYLNRRLDRLEVQMCLDYLKDAKAAELFFAGSPARTRAYGRTELVFDDWLYPVFEAVHLAEPRTTWLGRALTDGPVRFVITTSEDPVIDGVRERLESLGYVSRFKITSLYVWERFRAPRPGCSATP